MGLLNKPEKKPPPRNIPAFLTAIAAGITSVAALITAIFK